jgi:SAM-dependent MidA family methyltransferase
VKKQGALFERGVAFDCDFKWQDYPLQHNALSKLVEADQLPDGYVTEVCPAARGLIHSLSAALQTGVILMVDYGFSASEYYHPQRNEGTLMCHYQHYAHSNPFINVGLQDITAHVNFTAIAEAGLSQGLSLHGYCNQAQFLMNCGILDLLGAVSPDDAAAYMPMAAAVQKLLSPAEMGDLFKVISFTKNLAENDDLLLLGFVSGDKSHTL